MAFIRMGQEGSYVDIPYGSVQYLYDNGEDIEGWSDEQFAGVVIEALDGVDADRFDKSYLFEIKCGFEEYFGGIDHEYSGGVPQPERAEIFCQCVDSRFDGVELTDEMCEAMQDSFDRNDYVFDCAHCGEEFRPYLRTGEPYYCTDDECGQYGLASSWDVDVSVIRELDDIIDQSIETDDPERKQELKDEWDRVYEEKVENDG